MWPCSRCRTGRRRNGSSGRLSPRRTRSQNASEKRIRFRRREISLLDRFLSTVVNPVFYKLFVHAGKFRTTERCYRLRGLCKALSPVQYPSGGTGALCGDQTVPTVWPASARVRNRPSNTEEASAGKTRDTNVREPGREIGGRKKIYKKFAGTLLQVLKKCCII